MNKYFDENMLTDELYLNEVTEVFKSEGADGDIGIFVRYPREGGVPAVEKLIAIFLSNRMDQVDKIVDAIKKLVSNILWQQDGLTFKHDSIVTISTSRQVGYPDQVSLDVDGRVFYEGRNTRRATELRSTVFAILRVLYFSHNVINKYED